MAISYDMRGLDITDIREWSERNDYSDTRTNWDLFVSFVHILAVVRPMTDGEFTIKACKLAIPRIHAFEDATMQRETRRIPVMFIRRMIGLSTNIFPMADEEKFKTILGEILFTNSRYTLPNDWDKF